MKLSTPLLPRFDRVDAGVSLRSSASSRPLRARSTAAETGRGESRGVSRRTSRDHRDHHAVVRRDGEPEPDGAGRAAIAMGERERAQQDVGQRGGDTICPPGGEHDLHRLGIHLAGDREVRDRPPRLRHLRCDQLAEASTALRVFGRGHWRRRCGSLLCEAPRARAERMWPPLTGGRRSGFGSDGRRSRRRRRLARPSPPPRGRRVDPLRCRRRAPER